MRSVFSFERLSSCCQGHCVSLNSPPTSSPSIPISKVHIYFPRVNVQQVPACTESQVCMSTWTDTVIKKSSFCWSHFVLPNTSYEQRQQFQLLFITFYWPIQLHLPSSQRIRGEVLAELYLPPLPTVKCRFDRKSITALLPIWDACWGLYCACVWISCFTLSAGELWRNA